MTILLAAVLIPEMLFPDTAPDRNVAAVIRYLAPPPHSFKATLQTRLEQSTLADGARLRLSTRLELETGQVRQRLIVVEIQGECRIPAGFPAAWRPGPLGWTDRVDSQFLAFVFVDCKRVAEAVARADVYGLHRAGEDRVARAVALVIRHEMRHILLETSGHETKGAFKAALRAEELVSW